MVSTLVGNIYKMTKISQWNYEGNISMTKMNRGDTHVVRMMVI